MSGMNREPDVSRFAIHAHEAADPILGRLVERGLHDELKGRAYIIIDDADGRAHHVVFSDLELTGDAKPGAIVETRASEDADGRRRLSLATRLDLTIEAQVTASGATCFWASIGTRSSPPSRSAATGASAISSRSTARHAVSRRSPSNMRRTKPLIRLILNQIGRV